MNPFTTPGAFSWSELMTSDPAAALAFYGKLLGWTTETMTMPEGDYHVVKTQGQAIGGVMGMPKAAAEGGMPPHWGCYVTVADVDATAKLAASLGGRVVHGPEDIPNVGRFAVILDPQGAAFNVIAYSPQGG